MHGQRLEDVIELRHVGEPAPCEDLGPLVGDVEVTEKHATRGAVDDADEGLQERRLAGAVGS